MNTASVGTSARPEIRNGRRKLSTELTTRRPQIARNDRVPVVAVRGEPDRARSPDDGRADERDQREQHAQHAEDERDRQTRDPEADTEQDALHERRETDAHEDGARDVLQVRPEPSPALRLDRQQRARAASRSAARRAARRTARTASAQSSRAYRVRRARTMPPEATTACSSRFAPCDDPGLQLVERERRCARRSTPAAARATGNRSGRAADWPRCSAGSCRACAAAARPARRPCRRWRPAAGRRAAPSSRS